MAVAQGLTWMGADRFTGMNTREPEDLIADSQVKNVSNFLYEELGALKKLHQKKPIYTGSNSQFLDDDIYVDDFGNKFFISTEQNIVGSGYVSYFVPIDNPDVQRVFIRETISIPVFAIILNRLYSVSAPDDMMRHTFVLGQQVQSIEIKMDEDPVPPTGERLAPKADNIRVINNRLVVGGQSISQKKLTQGIDTNLPIIINPNGSISGAEPDNTLRINFTAGSTTIKSNNFSFYDRYGQQQLTQILDIDIPNSTYSDKIYDSYFFDGNSLYAQVTNPYSQSICYLYKINLDDSSSSEFYISPFWSAYAFQYFNCIGQSADGAKILIQASEYRVDGQAQGYVTDFNSITPPNIQASRIAQFGYHSSEQKQRFGFISGSTCYGSRYAYDAPNLAGIQKTASDNIGQTVLNFQFTEIGNAFVNYDINKLFARVDNGRLLIGSNLNNLSFQLLNLGLTGGTFSQITGNDEHLFLAGTDVLYIYNISNQSVMTKDLPIVDFTYHALIYFPDTNRVYLFEDNGTRCLVYDVASESFLTYVISETPMRRLKAGIYNNKICIIGHNKKLEIFTPTFDPSSDKKYYLAKENYRFTLDDPTNPAAIWYKITNVVSYNTAVIDIPFIGASGNYFVNMFAAPYVGAELNIGQKITYNNKIYTITTNQFSLGQLQITTTPPIDTGGQTIQYPESFYYFSNSYNSLNMSMENIQDKWNSLAPTQGFGNAEEWNFSENCVSFMEWQAAFIAFTTKTAWVLPQVAVEVNSPSGYGKPQRMRIPEGVLTGRSVLEKNNNIYMICKNGIYYSQGGALNINALEIVPISSVIYGSWKDVDITKLDTIALYSFKDLILMTYTPKEKVGQYTPRSRVLIIDTSSNSIEVQQISFAFGFIDDLEPTSFCEHNNKLYFGSYLDANIYEFNPDINDSPIPLKASFTTKRYDTRTESRLRSVMIKARGHGEVIVTPIIDGVICDLPLKSPPVPGHRRGEVMHFFFDDDTHAEEQYAPRANNPFGYIGNSIQLKVECNGAQENITIYPPKVGYEPMKLKEGGKRSGKSSSAVSFAGLY